MSRPAIDTLAKHATHALTCPAGYARPDPSPNDPDYPCDCGLADALASLRRLQTAAEELIALKDGPRDEDYERRKPEAWKALRDALAGCVGDPAPVPGAEEAQRDE